MTEWTLEELFFHMPRLAEKAPSTRERSFAADMAKRAHWRNWRLSKKQHEIMRRMVRETINEDRLMEVVER